MNLFLRNSIIATMSVTEMIEIGEKKIKKTYWNQVKKRN